MEYDTYSCPARPRLRQLKGGLSTSAVKTSITRKPLLVTLCAVVTVLYVLLDKLRNFVVGVFVPQYHYPYAVALCFGQVLISLCVVNLLHLLHLVPVAPYSRPLGEKLLVPSVCTSVHSVLLLWARSSGSHSGPFALSLPLLPLVSAGVGFLLKPPSLPSFHGRVLLSILSGTSVVITVSGGLSVEDPLEYLYAPLVSLLLGLSLNWLAKVSEAEQVHPSHEQASVFDIYYVQLVNQSWVLGVLWLLHPDSPWKVLGEGSWHSLLFHGYLLALLLLGMVLNFLALAFALRVSSVSAAMLHAAGPLVQTFVSLL